MARFKKVIILIVNSMMFTKNCKAFSPKRAVVWLIGRAVAFNTRGPRFESSHRQNLYCTFFTINCIEKTKIKKKEAGNGPFFLKKYYKKLFRNFHFSAPVPFLIIVL